MKPLTQVQKGQILAFVKAGWKQADICEEMEIHRSVISRLLTRVKLEGEEQGVKIKPKSGRKRKTNEEERARLIAVTQEFPFLSAKAIKEKAGLDHLHVRMVQRILRKAGLGCYRSVKKPFLTDAMKQKRIDWCNTHLHWGEDQWERVMFSDESNFKMVRMTSRLVRRPKGERFNPKFLTPTVKHPLWIMVWGSFSGATGRHGLFVLPKGKTMDQHVYREVLEEKVQPRFQGNPNLDWYLQDGAPCHTAKSVKTFLETSGIPLMPWPGNSPDLNPIENAWNFMKDCLEDFSCSNREELIQRVTEIWCHRMTPEFCSKLARSMPRRIRAVLANNGGHTKY